MTYYDLLEISENASEEVIKMAYKALAKKYHPDVFQGDYKEAEEKMKQINMAYSVLLDKDKRTQYDAVLRSEKLRQKQEQYTTRSKIFVENSTSRKKTFYVAIVALIFICGAFFLVFTTTQNIEKTKDSVVMVEVYNNNGALIASGSGFCAYESDWIVTNFHVIEGAKSITIVTDDREEFFVENIVLFDKVEDLAILKINGELKPLKLGNGNKIETKDHITTVGSPKGELNTVSEGIVSNVDDKKQIRISAPISHGSSGGVLLNEKNEVIGITSSGYDDAQNLNFAINISVLEQLFYDFENGNVIVITDDNVSKYMGNLNDFENYLSFELNPYTISSLDTFNKLTDNTSRFEYLLKRQTASWYSIYSLLSSDDQRKVVDLFMELKNYTFDDENVDTDIAAWNVEDFFISLNVLNEYQYAITLVDMENYDNKRLMYENLEDKYLLEAAQKSLILYLIGGYEWYEIHVDNKADIFYYFDDKYETEDLGAILETLGYEVVYKNDGTLTGYW